MLPHCFPLQAAVLITAPKANTSTTAAAGMVSSANIQFTHSRTRVCLPGGSCVRFPVPTPPLPTICRFRSSSLIFRVLPRGRPVQTRIELVLA